MKFNKVEFNNFRNDLKDAVKELESKYNVKIDPENISFSHLEFTLKLKVVKHEEGIDVDKEKFEKECRYYGFSKEHYKASFVVQGKEYKLVGFNSRSPKNNCSILEVCSGKTYKTNDQVVKRALKIA